MAYFNHILINGTLAFPTQITLQHATHRMTIPLKNPYNSSTRCTQVLLHILLLLLLSRCSRVRLFATPQTAAHQAPPSLGFSRQEHWSGLPLPSPMHESEK